MEVRERGSILLDRILKVHRRQSLAFPVEHYTLMRKICMAKKSLSQTPLNEDARTVRQDLNSSSYFCDLRGTFQDMYFVAG